MTTTAAQPDLIDGSETRAPVLPRAFSDAWRDLERLHRIPPTVLHCTHSTVRLDAAGAEMAQTFVSFGVSVGGVSYTFIRRSDDVVAAAREMWMRSGRPA